MRASAFRTAITRMRRRAVPRIAALFLASLALVAIFADVFASDLPLVCVLHGKLHVLPAVTHARELAGMSCADVRREGGHSIEPLVCHGPVRTSEYDRLKPPMPGHPLGTDSEGRDALARLAHGARTELSFAVATALVFVLFGGLAGALAGFFGGTLDALVTRLIETLASFPTLILVLGVQAIVPRPSAWTLFLALVVTRWSDVARLVRAEVVRVKRQDFVLAARSLGASPLRVLVHHVLPHATAPVLVAFSFGVAQVVLTEAALTFLRVGYDPTMPSWGEMLSEVRTSPGAYWLLAPPLCLLFGAVASFNLVGEAFRDALDPRLRELVQHDGGAARPSAERMSQLPPPSAFFDAKSGAESVRSPKNP